MVDSAGGEGSTRGNGDEVGRDTEQKIKNRNVRDICIERDEI
jgi:hypothetical protein